MGPHTTPQIEAPQPFLVNHHTPKNKSDNANINKSQWWTWNVHGADPIKLHRAMNNPKIGWQWFFWLVHLLGGSTIIAMLFSIEVFTAWVVFIFWTSTLIPDPGTVVWPYFNHLVLPLMVVRGWREGGPWSCYLLWWAFGMLPLMDAAVGMDVKVLARYTCTRERRALAANKWFRLPALAAAPVAAGLLLWAARDVGVGTRGFTRLEFAGLCLSVGVYCGGMSLVFGHELGHRHHHEDSSFPWARAEQLAARVLLCLTCYGHFSVEHNRGHHKRVGTDADPGTARLGEGYWYFAFRAICGEHISAWRLESQRVAERDLLWWHHELIWTSLAQAALALGLYAAWGPRAMVLYFGQSLTGHLLFQVVNYIEHYGLERRQRADGTPAEAVAPRHAWDSPARFGNMAFLNLMRHADHHARADKRWPLLDHRPEAPQLPSGYALCALMAFAPPLWRRLVDPRVAAHRASDPGLRGQVFRHTSSKWAVTTKNEKKEQ